MFLDFYIKVAYMAFICAFKGLIQKFKDSLVILNQFKPNWNLATCISFFSNTQESCTALH